MIDSCLLVTESGLDPRHPFAENPSCQLFYIQRHRLFLSVQCDTATIFNPTHKDSITGLPGSIQALTYDPEQSLLVVQPTTSDPELHFLTKTRSFQMPVKDLGKLFAF